KRPVSPTWITLGVMEASREVGRAVAGIGQTTAKGTDALSLALWSTAILVAALALPDANWADHLWIVPTIAAEGLILGWILLSTRFSARRVLLVCTGYGFVLILGHAAALLDPAVAWRERVFNVGHRLSDFGRLIAAGKPSYDSLPFVLAASVVFWFLAALGTWSVFRRGQLWRVVLLAGAAVFLNDYYYGLGGRLPLHLPLFLLAILGLLVRLELVGYRRGWEERGAHVAPFASLQVMQVGLLISLALVAIAWISPRLPEMRLPSFSSRTGGSSPFQEALSDALAGLRGPAAPVAQPYGASLQLGAGQAAGQGEVFSATTARPLPARARVYWRARVFDTYRGGLWTTEAAVAADFDPSHDRLPDPLHAGRVGAEFEISPATSGMTELLLPQEVAWIDRPATTEQVALGGSLDVVEAATTASLESGQAYRVRSRIAVPQADELRRSPHAGPEAVPAAYLEVPDDLAGRLANLAGEITQGAPTDYDKAESIVDWLRRSMHYVRESPGPPTGEDPVAWFLFDDKEGFCDYYASAAVLLLRSAGIPSRLAVGYAQGAYDAARRRYLVQAEDSHAWPEVYFPGIGWVEFEPTASEPPLDRGGPAAGAAGANEQEDLLVPRSEIPREESPGGVVPLPPSAASRVETRREVESVLGGMAVGVLLALVAAMIVSAGARRRLTRAALAGASSLGLRPSATLLAWSAPPASEASVAYRRMAPWPERLGVRLEGEATPGERAQALAQAVPDAEALIARIADEYSAERYGERPGGAQARRAWLALRPRLYRLLVAQWLRTRFGRGALSRR
ncbi:MAG TPA: transglutaminase domain-containing protein, partial [Anaerolineales bacterium]|nr:transglutaminase domain-containing protein [Anaerolineales bacterium]